MDAEFIAFDDPEYEAKTRALFAAHKANVEKSEDHDKLKKYTIAILAKAEADAQMMFQAWAAKKTFDEAVEKFLSVEGQRRRKDWEDALNASLSMPVWAMSRDQLLVGVTEIKANLAFTSRDLAEARRTIDKCCSRNQPAPPPTVQPMTEAEIDAMYDGGK